MQFGYIELALVGAIIAIIFYILKLSRSQAVPQKTVDLPDSSSEEEESEKPKFTILYGSQSGTAETFADELKEEASQYGIDATVIQLEEYDFETDLQEEAFPVFLMATYGEGEPTDDAVTFYEWITDTQHEEDTFEKLTFSVFALGNRQYEHFCNVGLNVHKILGEHGGKALLRCGTGDDDGSMDDDWAAWKAEFWDLAKDHFGLAGQQKVIEKMNVPFTVEMVHHPKDKEFTATETAHAEYDAAAAKVVSGPEGFNADEKFQAHVVTMPVNRELRQDTFEGNTRHIEFELPAGMDYTTADNLGVFAHNDFKITGKLITRLGLHPKSIMRVRSSELSFRSIFPAQCTVMDALLWYTDHTSVPRAAHLEQLTAYCADKLDKSKLTRWATGDLKDEYAQDKKNWLEVLEECPSIDLPFNAFLHMVPKLAMWPRYYTISSSSRLHPRQVSITVTASPTTLPRGREYNGICSTYLRKLSPGATLCAFVRASTFRLPEDNRPVIMFGPGTGVAPFRAFWQEAKLNKEQGKPVTDWHLFFGCRYSDKDWIYKDEMAELEDLGIQLHTAFSRDSSQKLYVQNLLDDFATGAEIWKLLKEKNARVFVCGGTSMGRSVKEGLTRLASKHGDLSSKAAVNFIKGRVDAGEYIQELWS